MLAINVFRGELQNIVALALDTAQSVIVDARGTAFWKAGYAEELESQARVVLMNDKGSMLSFNRSKTQRAIATLLIASQTSD